MFKNICWVNWLFIIMVGILSVISIGTLVSGCGNKGALYMPDESTKTPPAKPFLNKQTPGSN